MRKANWKIIVTKKFQYRTRVCFFRDLYGRKRIYSICLVCGVLWFAMAAISVYLRNIYVMFSCSIFVGIAGACVWLPRIILADLLPENDLLSHAYVKLQVLCAFSTSIITIVVGLTDFYKKIDYSIFFVIGGLVCFLLLIINLVMVPKLNINESTWQWKDFIALVAFWDLWKFDQVTFKICHPFFNKLKIHEFNFSPHPKT